MYLCVGYNLRWQLRNLYGTTLTNDHHEHRSDTQPTDFVELVHVIGPRLRRRTSAIRYGPSYAIDAGGLGQFRVVLVVVRGVRVPAERQVDLFGVQHGRYVVQHVRAVVPAVHLVQFALGRRDHRRKVHVPGHDLQHLSAYPGRGPSILSGVPAHHDVRRLFVPHAPYRATAHVARFPFAREQIDARLEPAVLPVVQQERPAQLTAPVTGKRPVRVHVNGAVVHHQQSDDINVFAVTPEVPEHPSDTVHGHLPRPHGHEMALLRDVQQFRVQVVLGQEREHALHLLHFGERRIRYYHFWALHRHGERIHGRRVVRCARFVEIHINSPSVEVRPCDVRQTIEQFVRRPILVH